MTELDILFLAKADHIHRLESLGIIYDYLSRAAESRQNGVFQEVYYHRIRYPSSWNSLHPFSEVICGSQDPFVLSARMGVNFSYKI
jgi:hypothetical protein